MERYRDLINRFAHIPGLELNCLGRVKTASSDYPFYQAHSKERDDKGLCRICLAAGVHGDEAAGVEAVVRFLENRPNLNGINLSVFPCLNPAGYDHGIRENGDGIDLNRQFDRRNPPREILLIRNAVAGCRYDFFICCHDDAEAKGFYLYEARRGRRPGFGLSIVSAIRQMAPIDQRPRIDGRINRNGILIPTNWHRRKARWSMALYLYKFGTPHCLIFESPASLPFEQKVRVHVKALEHFFSSLRQRVNR